MRGFIACNACNVCHMFVFKGKIVKEVCNKPCNVCNLVINMTDKSISAVVDEFRSAFGRFEFKAVNLKTGQVGGSRGWKDQVPARLEISGADYLALGQLGKMQPSPGVIAGLLKISLGNR